jgi:hypothetical protein
VNYIIWTALSLCITVWCLVAGAAWWIIALNVIVDVLNIVELVSKARRGTL